MSPTSVDVPVEAEVLAGALDRHVDYRVLRRVRPMDRGLQGVMPRPALVGLAIALKTTGADHRRHEVIELAMQRFTLDAQGMIVETGPMRSWLEQPSEPLLAEVRRAISLTDRDLAGRTVSEGEATSLILSSDFTIAFDARVVRPFVDRRLPLAAGRPWACVLNDVDWSELGQEGRTLPALLSDAGWFSDGRRAEDDVAALMRVLDRPLNDWWTVAGRAVERARRPTWTLEAADAPVPAREVLLERGYRWDIARSLWVSSVPDDRLKNEIGWARMMLYGGRRAPTARRVTWETRYAAAR